MIVDRRPWEHSYSSTDPVFFFTLVAMIIGNVNITSFLLKGRWEYSRIDTWGFCFLCNCCCSCCFVKNLQVKYICTLYGSLTHWEYSTESWGWIYCRSFFLLCKNFFTVLFSFPGTQRLSPSNTLPFIYPLLTIHFWLIISNKTSEETTVEIQLFVDVYETERTIFPLLPVKTFKYGTKIRLFPSVLSKGT